MNCYYCNACIRNPVEMDHFPKPKRHGGEETIPTCISCHDMKDRFCLEDWPGKWLDTVKQDMPLLSRETKIWLAKLMALTFDIKELE